jgi:hypothetical protein
MHISEIVSFFSLIFLFSSREALLQWKEGQNRISKDSKTSFCERARLDFLGELVTPERKKDLLFKYFF